MLCFQRRAFFLLTALLCASLPASEAGGEPGIPQDLRVTPHGPSTVLLTWMKPSSNDVDHYLVYVEGEDLEHTTHNTFFALDGLAASTAYTFGVRTVSASAVMSEPALVDGQTSVDSAAEDKPDPPQNVQVFPQGSHGILVVWEEPSSSDVDHYYVYVEGTGLEGTTPKTVTYYDWEGLESCTTYTFGVQTVSSSGVYSDPVVVDGETGANKPPEPQGLQVEKTTYNAVTLTWEKPDTPCDIEQYRVTHQEDGSLVEENFVTDTTAEVSQLKPETFYTFKVYAVTSAGEGPPASITQTTAAGPGPPQNLTAEGVSSSAIHVSWSDPRLPPDYYLITAFEAGITEERVLDADPPEFLIDTGLDPCQTCTITVYSVYEALGSRFDASTRSETEADIPGPPKDCSVEAQELYITVTWDKPTSHCALGPYSVDWTVKKLWGNFEEESYSTNTTGNSFVVPDTPLPYHSYTFEIAASVDGMFGDSISCSGTSLETSAGPPVLVSVVAEEEGEVQVEWEPPAEENGEIIEYGIFVNDAADFVKNVSGEVCITTVPLEKCVNVDISVAARNHADNDNDGWGERSAAKSVTTTGDVVPDDIECLVFGVYLQACWFPYSKDCPASQYNLEWDGVVLWSSGDTDSGSATLDWSEDKFCYNISTVPYTEYTVSLNVGNNAEVPVTCSATSPMAAPGPPTLEKLEAEELTIIVTWEEPLEKNGVISNYSVEWTDWNDEVSSHVTDGDTSSYQIMLNSCGGEVGVTVSAKTAEFDDFGERSPSSSILVVSPISDLSCEAKAPGELELGWELQNSNCPGHFYNVTWSYASLWSDDKGSGFESFNGSVLSATLENLEPYSEVSVVVHVENSPQAAICNATTQQEAPGPPTLDELQVDNATISVTWKEPQEKNGIISNYRVEWTDWNDKVNSKVTDGNTFLYEIMLNSCGGEVDVTVSAKTAGFEEFGERSQTRSASLANTVLNLTCESTSPGEVALSWMLQDSKCPIYLYNVSWSFTSLWSEDEGSGWEAVETNVSSVTLESLPPYSDVSVALHVTNSDPAPNCTATTLEEASSPPRNLQQIAKELHSITVEWSLPEFSRGKLSGWYLYWTSAIGHFLGEQDMESPEERALEIASLEPSEVYYVYVMAVNGAGRGEEAVVEVATQYVPWRGVGGGGGHAVF